MEKTCGGMVESRVMTSLMYVFEAFERMEAQHKTMEAQRRSL
jgi:hypothetical protein